MAIYLSTQQLSTRSGVGVDQIRVLEERGVLKAVAGREKYRKRWGHTAVYDVKRALTLYPPENNHPFNAALAPGALAAAAAPPPPETPVRITTIEEAMAHFRARNTGQRMSGLRARAIATAWLEVRPHSRNDTNAIVKVAESVNRNERRKISPQSVRPYLFHLGLTEHGAVVPMPTAKRGRGRPRLTDEQRAIRNAEKAAKAREHRAALRAAPATAPIPLNFAGMDKNTVSLLQHITALSLTPQQRVFILAWLQLYWSK